MCNTVIYFVKYCQIEKIHRSYANKILDKYSQEKKIRKEKEFSPQIKIDLFGELIYQ